MTSLDPGGMFNTQLVDCQGDATRLDAGATGCLVWWVVGRVFGSYVDVTVVFENHYTRGDIHLRGLQRQWR